MLVIPHHGWTPHDRLVQPFHGAGRVAGPTEPAANVVTTQSEPVTDGGENLTYAEA